MKETILILLGTAMVSGGLSYAWWCRVRTVILCQQIYDIRERLFDEAARLNRLDDAAYQTTREHMNRLVGAAPMISFAVMGAMLMQGVDCATYAKNTRTADHRLQQFIDAAMKDASNAVLRHLLHRTATGWLACGLAKIGRMNGAVNRQLSTWSGRWVCSTAADTLRAGSRMLRSRRRLGLAR